MKNELRISIHRLTACGILACVYAVLTIATAAFAYGPIQFRIAEALCILPFFVPWSIWGLTMGCVLANLFSTVSALDVVVGTAATLLAAFLTSRCRKPWLAPLPPVICNAVFVGALIAATGMPEAFWEGFWLFALQVGAGELAVMYLLGLPLLLTLKRQGLGERLRSIP
ncbi:MAG: QueT transporter family protein [Ruminococcaceae bacterium]|nr:QueT transporter family protein [Oscillospiraceae bacterium]